MSRRPARPQPIVGHDRARSARLRTGQPGYRLRLPEQVHPISAGIKGGIVGGLVMPLPALAYGYLSGHGIWYPVNLLAGMVLPGVDADERSPNSSSFKFRLLLTAVVIHVVMSVTLGLIYGVLMPTLPEIPKPLAWGGLLMPLLWTAISYVLMGCVNPLLRAGVDWPWFVVSQFIFGVVAGAGRHASHDAAARPLAGLLGGLVGGVLMAVPAIAWSLATGHGIWYPVNLLAGMVLPRHGESATSTSWSSSAPIGLWRRWRFMRRSSAAFGLVYGLLLTAAAADSGRAGLGRPAAAAAVDRGQLQPDGRGQSGAPAAGRLALVYRVAVRVRRWRRRWSSCARK